MCCFTQSIHTLRLSVGGRTHARTHGRTDRRTENIYSIFREKLLLLGEHGLSTLHLLVSTLISTCFFSPTNFISIYRKCYETTFIRLPSRDMNILLFYLIPKQVVVLFPTMSACDKCSCNIMVITRTGHCANKVMQDKVQEEVDYMV